MNAMGRAVGTWTRKEWRRLLRRAGLRRDAARRTLPVLDVDPETLPLVPIARTHVLDLPLLPDERSRALPLAQRLARADARYVVSQLHPTLQSALSRSAARWGDLDLVARWFVQVGFRGFLARDCAGTALDRADLAGGDPGLDALLERLRGRDAHGLLVADRAAGPGAQVIVLFLDTVGVQTIVRSEAVHLLHRVPGSPTGRWEKVPGEEDGDGGLPLAWSGAPAPAAARRRRPIGPGAFAAAAALALACAAAIDAAGLRGSAPPAVEALPAIGWLLARHGTVRWRVRTEVTLELRR